jgi:hypothetical protein
MKLYIASSFRIATEAAALAKALTGAGYTTFNPTDLNSPFVVQGGDFPGLTSLPWQEFLRDPVAEAANEHNLEAIAEADVVILLRPLSSGKSAHVEAGIAIGLGKYCVAYEPGWSGGLQELVYFSFDKITTEFTQLVECLAQGQVTRIPRIPYSGEARFASSSSMNVRIVPAAIP